ncbi:lytic transglycosylase domain-containing protein [Pseudohoeflea suaedae]|nr:lytic transglycosylase domain-containing protein [Pseudohoeflea suaedae]
MLSLVSGMAGAPARALDVPMPVPVDKPRLDENGDIIVEHTLQNGLAALDDGNVEQAREVLASLETGRLDEKILSWAMAMSRGAGLPASELAEARDRFAGWPGDETIATNFEIALYRENRAPAQLLAAFEDKAPVTVMGKIAVANALGRLDREDEAREKVKELWNDVDLDSRTASLLAREFSSLLSKEDQLVRMKRLLYRDRIKAALAPARAAGAESLYQAWVQTIRTPKGANTAIDKVDDAFKDDPALTYLKIRHLRQLDEIDQAAALFEQMPNEDAALIDPEEWWVEQRIVSRSLFEKGEAEKAWKVASAHKASDPKIAAEAEFHAGWYALRGMNDPEKAKVHFQRLLTLSGTRSGQARAYYWLARTAEASKPGGAEGDPLETAALYEKAAQHPANFYGQLAASALERKPAEFADPQPAPSDRANFDARDTVQALEKLEAIGEAWRARQFYGYLAETLESPGELTLLANKARVKSDYRLALRIGKIGWQRGLEVGALAFPLGVMPRDADTTGSGLALAYSIARQESAFDLSAVSPANARGLLQLLPGTAREVANRHGLAYSPERLTRDAGYNATLGSHYLAEQIDRFGGSYILTFIAYNAGPKRVNEWIARFGDPRGMPLDEVIDWVESIPFPETRNYVQHVLENYEIYKARLGEAADIGRDLRLGRNG